MLHSMKSGLLFGGAGHFFISAVVPKRGLRVKMCVWLGVSRGLDLAFLNAD